MSISKVLKKGRHVPNCTHSSSVFPELEPRCFSGDLKVTSYLPPQVFARTTRVRDPSKGNIPCSSAHGQVHRDAPGHISLHTGHIVVQKKTVRRQYTTRLWGTGFGCGKTLLGHLSLLNIQMLPECIHSLDTPKLVMRDNADGLLHPDITGAFFTKL